MVNIKDQMESLMPSASQPIPEQTTTTTTGMTPQEADVEMGMTMAPPAPVFPAIVGKPEVTTAPLLPFKIGETELSALGMGFAEERDYYFAVDPKKVTPNVSITEVMDFKNPEMYALFNDTKSVVDARGYRYDIDPSLPIAEKVRAADQLGAIRFITSDDDEIDIPWYKAIEQAIKIPEGIDLGVLKSGIQINSANLSTSDLKRARSATMAISALATNPEVGRPLYAGYINDLLIKNGVDERSRAIILRDRLSDPMMGDFENVVYGGLEVVGRSVIETGLWGVGEALDWVDGFGPNTGISDFRGRQAIMDEMWPTLPDVLQQRFAQKGVYIDLATAEDLAFTFSGLLPRAAKIAAEMMSLTKFQAGFKGALSEIELESFEKFLANEIRKNPDLTTEDAFDMYAKNKGKFGIFGEVSDKKLPKKVKKIEERIATAYQIVDSRLEPKLRAEVQVLRKDQAQLLLTRNSLVKKNQRLYTEATDNQIRNLNARIEQNRINLQNAERISSVPKFMRDAKVQDAYMIAGGASVGHFFGQEFGMIDPALGDFVGIAVGMALSTAQGKVPRGLAFIGSDKRTKEMRTLVEELSNADPLLARQIEANGLKIMRLFDRMEMRGVDRSKLDATIPIITDLVHLRHIADSLKKSLSVGDAFSKDIALDFQKSYTQLQDLNAELNRLIGEMGPLNEADETFFEFMSSMSKAGRKLEDSLSNDLKVINEKGVGHYLNALTGNFDIIDENAIDTLPEGVMALTFPEAVGSLLNKGLFKKEFVNKEEFDGFVQTAVAEINSGLRSAAARMQERLGMPKSKREALYPSVGKGRSSLISENANGSTLFAFQLEGANEVRRAIAARPYIILKDKTKAKFRDANGNPLSNNISVNGFDIFQKLFTLSKEVRITRGKETKGLQRIADDVIVTISTPMFEALATSQGKKFDDVIKDLRKYLESPEGGGYRFEKGRNTQAQVAEFIEDLEIKEGFTAGMFDMSPSALRDLDVLIRTEANKANQAGKGDIADILYNLSDRDIEEKFSQFTIDGRQIGEIFLELPGQKDVVELKKYLDESGAVWRQYKEDFHDRVGGSLIPSLLFNNRIKLDKPNNKFPTGISTAKQPQDWLTADMLIDEASATRYMNAINDAMGTEVMFDGQMRRKLVDGDPFTEGQKIIVKQIFSEWIDANVVNGTATTDQIADVARKLTENLRMVDAEGKDIPLFNFMEALDNNISFSRKSIDSALYEKEMEKAASLINTQLTKATEPARVLREGIKDASDLLERFSSEKIGSAEIASELIGGGMARYTQIRENMLLLVNKTGEKKYTPEQVDDILAHAYINGMRRFLFSKTGRKQAKVEENLKGEITTTFSDILSENPQALLRFLGETDEEKRVARLILGKDRYETMEDIAQVMIELSDNPLAQSPSVAVRGVPRALSVESYISRFYAINRGVVRPQYVGTEALLQTLRFKNSEFLTAMLTDPKLGRDFLEMFRTQKPLSPQREAQFVTALIQAHALASKTFQSETRVVVDPASREYTVTATPEQKFGMGSGPEETQAIIREQRPTEGGSYFGPSGTIPLVP